MQWHRSGLIATWQFVEGHNADDREMTETPLVDKKWGAMVMIKSLQFLPDVISSTLKETSQSQNGHAGFANRGNMMHIALAGINNQMSLLQDRYAIYSHVYFVLIKYLNYPSKRTCCMIKYSGDEDQAQERVNRLAKILKDKEVSSNLKNAGYGVISCIIQRDEGRGPMRHSFHWSEENHYYIEEPILRHLEPPLSIYLELVYTQNTLH